MFGIYTPVLLLQAFCIYHAYRSNAEQRWYWLIVFLPLVGCTIYMIHTFNNRETLDALKETVKETVISNYKIEQLEKALRFSESLRNKVNLAEAYVEVGRYQDAIDLYTSCLQGFMSDDTPLRMKVLKAYFLSGAYDKVIEFGSLLHGDKEFKNSEERAAYAWALYYEGRVHEAEKVFDDLDQSFSNYYHRLEYCKFLLKIEKPDPAKDKLMGLMEEFDQMQGIERRGKRNILREVKDLYATNFGAA